MDSGFQYDRNLSSAVNRHAISFNSSGGESTSDMIMMGDYYLANGSTSSTRYLGNSSIGNGSPGFTQSGNNSSGSVPGLKLDAGLAVEWSVEEQHKLEDGLSK
nr:hypothetical protein [Tanacetum cinerariifolium]